jgi:hypothetical protein
MYLTHDTGVNLAQEYLNTAMIAQQLGKPFMMFETNTASCGGFPGVSDAFAAALWGLDYGMTLAYSNFTGALFHFGGQSVYYNPFTPPPTNQSAFHQWTVGVYGCFISLQCLLNPCTGPMYYANLAMAEVLGKSNQSQVIDLNANGGNPSTPGYAIYENGNPMKVALFNYLDDNSGAHDLSVAISPGGNTPASVRVKYLLADHVTARGNFTWAGQTFGAEFQSDGRLQGELNVVTVPCDATTNTCTVTVPAPGFALVFLNDQAYTDSTPSGPTTTFATTAFTKGINTATIDPQVLETSNGHSGKDRTGFSSTSKGSSPNGATTLMDGLGGVLLGCLGAGLGAVLFALF